MKIIGIIALCLTITRVINAFKPGAVQEIDLFLMSFGMLMIVLSEK